MYTKITHCRLCKTEQLETILSLGAQALTGIFPKQNEADAPKAPLELVKCSECHLVQLAHNFDMSKLYGSTYGYRSGLNQSMVKHLQTRVAKVMSLCSFTEGDLVVDIGSNDGTTLRNYPSNLQRIGIDPSGTKFLHYYPEGAELIADFFSAKKIQEKTGNKKAKAVTSIAMFYDLEEPQTFVNEIAEILMDDGVWLFEQSYLPAMLEANSYDTICHEHLEYYGLGPILYMLDRAKLKLVDIEHNDVNGGSFALVAAKKTSPLPECTEKITATLAREDAMGLKTLKPYQEFKERIEKSKTDLLAFFSAVEKAGLTLLGYGASTKGNVLLQYCQIDKQQIAAVAEVNPDKFGSKTPGTEIPIISEEEANRLHPNIYMVLPWHFRQGILMREKAFLEEGGAFLFPLPYVELVTRDGILRGAEAIEYVAKVGKPVLAKEIPTHL